MKCTVATQTNRELLAQARAAQGFMPEDEGLALHRLARERLPHGPVLEVGGTVFTVDHHRGSEENQAGWEHHDPTLVDAESGLMDTLPTFRRTIERAGLEGHVVAVVGPSLVVSAHWRTPLSLLFVDGGHGERPAMDDYAGWAPWVQRDGLLAIHDVFPDPADGGRPPYDLFLRALASGAFEEREAVGSLRVLRRTAGVAGEPVG